MRVDDFDYALPPDRIAQRPADRREDARLLVLDRATGALEHGGVAGIADRLRPGDLLVLNDTRVLPARLAARKPTGGAVELLLVEPAGDADTGVGVRWRCLLNASRKPAAPWSLECAGGLGATVEGRDGDTWLVRFAVDEQGLAGHLECHGELPLPPYIDAATGVNHAERYQTVYARKPGAVAAPTAGLHFSDALFASLGDRGVEVARLTLHVGPGTFLPVRAERVEDHRMHAERYALPAETANAVNTARATGRRVVAVGTTVVRVLEHCARESDTGVRPGSGRSQLFIYPGYRFRAVDAMITNFHLPRSTLLMLVGAFGGRERVLAAYREAVEREYRFYSYGDAMLIEDAE